MDKEFFPGEDALMIPKTSDGRVLFAVPWHDKVVVGTTDTPLDEHSLEPKALEEEIEFILATAKEYLIQAPTRKDVKSVFAGLRPLAAPQGRSCPANRRCAAGSARAQCAATDAASCG